MRISLSDNSKAQVMKAIELINSGKEHFCCHALDTAAGGQTKAHGLVEAFKSFYGYPKNNLMGGWLPELGALDDKALNIRVLLLLLFLEAGS